MVDVTPAFKGFSRNNKCHFCSHLIGHTVSHRTTWRSSILSVAQAEKKISVNSFNDFLVPRPGLPMKVHRNMRALEGVLSYGQ